MADRSDDPTARNKPPAGQPRNPLHGVTLERMITDLAEHHGWDGLSRRIAVRCFSHDPSVASSLKFLRKTPWARAKVETLWLETWRARSRAAAQAAKAAADPGQ